MKPCERGRLLVGAIMALALMSYLTITASASKATGAGIYEVELSDLAYADFLTSSLLRPDRRLAHH